MRNFICLPFFLLVLTASLAAQEIAGVSFRQEGDYKYSEDLFKYNVQTRKGQMYSERAVNDDVRRLYSLGVFSDVVSMVDDLPDGKKTVTFRVRTKPVVTAVEFQGNKKYAEKKLREFVKIAEGTPLNDKQLHDAADQLRKFYAGEGLNDATVSPDLITDKSGVKVVFRIVENLRLRVNNVAFEGAAVYPMSELRSALETRYSFLSQSWLSWLPLDGGFGLLDREALQRDKVRLRELYWRKGYLDFKVKDVRVEAEPGNPELVNVTFSVEEGDPYFVGRIGITGATRFTEEELRSLLTQKEEDVYSSLREDHDQRAVEAKYTPLGYCDIQVHTAKRPDFRTHTVDLDYVVKEGPPYTINEVYISGNKWTKDHVIRRELLLYPDDPVDQSLIDISRNRLLGMGYFEGDAKAGDPGVEIVTVNTREPGKKDIHINVKERRFIDGKIGAGWSDTDSLAGMIELSHSNMDILDPRHYFTGGGQRMRIMALAGLEHMDVQADFTEPWLFGIPLRLDISGYWREVTYEDWNERRIGFSVGLTKRIFDDFTTISGGYTFEQVRVYEMRRRMSPVFQDQKGNELVGRMHLSLTRDTRNSATNPTSGYEIGAYAALTTQALGATNDYYKLELRGVNYLPFFHDWFVLTTGFKVGTMNTFNGDKVPLFDRYFLGGGDSIRGFPYRSIGPTDYNEDNYGGEFMYLFTAELSHPIYSVLRGAFFVDIGDVTSGSLGPMTEPNIGIGYGLRIKLPQVDVPIRLDLAYPILCNQEGVSRKLRFHFNMGFSI